MNKPRNKTWLGKTLKPRPCLRSSFERINGHVTWCNTDETVFIYYDPAILSTTYECRVELPGDCFLVSPCFRTEQAARKNVERQLDALFVKCGQLRGYIEDENAEDDGNPLGSFA